MLVETRGELKPWKKYTTFKEFCNVLQWCCKGGRLRGLQPPPPPKIKNREKKRGRGRQKEREKRNQKRKEVEPVIPRTYAVMVF